MNNLSTTQELVLYISVFMSFLVGLLLGISGKHPTMKWWAKVKPYLFWLGIALGISVIIWNIIDGTTKF